MKKESYFQYKVVGDAPTSVGEIADALKAAQSIYRITLYREKDLLSSFDEKLYISRVKEGSQIYEFISIAAIGTLPLVSDLNATAAFFKNVKELSDYFLRKKVAPKRIKPRDCSNAANFVLPGASSPGGLIIGVGQGDVNIENLELRISPEESSTIYHNAMVEKTKLEAPEVELKQNQILRVVQANAIRTSTQGTSSPDKGIIEDIALESYSLVFDEELREEKARLLKDNNFYTSEFLVDVEIARSNGKLKAYVIKKITLI